MWKNTLKQDLSSENIIDNLKCNGLKILYWGLIIWILSGCWVSTTPIKEESIKESNWNVTKIKTYTDFDVMEWENVIVSLKSWSLTVNSRRLHRDLSTNTYSTKEHPDESYARNFAIYDNVTVIYKDKNSKK